MRHQICFFFLEIFDRQGQLSTVLHHEYSLYFDHHFTNNLAAHFGAILEKQYVTFFPAARENVFFPCSTKFV